MRTALTLIARSSATVAILAALAVSPAAARDEVGAPLPGYWEMTNTWVFVFHFKTVDHRCFTAADVAGVLQGPSNAHYACTYPTREVGDGHLVLKGTCVETHGQVAEISAQGDYDPTTFHLTADLRTKIAGIPLKGTGITAARRLGDVCPVEIPKPRRGRGSS
jgi:Protein of unknown function (DUF3617)